MSTLSNIPVHGFGQVYSLLMQGTHLPPILNILKKTNHNLELLEEKDLFLYTSYLFKVMTMTS